MAPEIGRSVVVSDRIARARPGKPRRNCDGWRSALDRNLDGYFDGDTSLSGTDSVDARRMPRQLGLRP